MKCKTNLNVCGDTVHSQNLGMMLLFLKKVKLQGVRVEKATETRSRKRSIFPYPNNTTDPYTQVRRGMEARAR